MLLPFRYDSSCKFSLIFCWNWHCIFKRNQLTKPKDGIDRKTTVFLFFQFDIRIKIVLNVGKIRFLSIMVLFLNNLFDHL